jgi:hypothetical protein
VALQADPQAGEKGCPVFGAEQDQKGKNRPGNNQDEDLAKIVNWYH